MTGIVLFDEVGGLSSCRVEILEGHENFVWRDVVLGLHENFVWRSVLLGLHENSVWRNVLLGHYENFVWRDVLLDLHGYAILTLKDGRQ